MLLSFGELFDQIGGVGTAKVDVEKMSDFLLKTLGATEDMTESDSMSCSMSISDAESQWENHTGPFSTSLSFMNDLETCKREILLLKKTVKEHEKTLGNFASLFKKINKRCDTSDSVLKETSQTLKNVQENNTQGFTNLYKLVSARPTTEGAAVPTGDSGETGVGPSRQQTRREKSNAGKTLRQGNYPPADGSSFIVINDLVSGLLSFKKINSGNTASVTLKNEARSFVKDVFQSRVEHKSFIRNKSGKWAVDVSGWGVFIEEFSKGRTFTVRNGEVTLAMKVQMIN